MQRGGNRSEHRRWRGEEGWRVGAVQRGGDVQIGEVERKEVKMGEEVRRGVDLSEMQRKNGRGSKREDLKSSTPHPCLYLSPIHLKQEESIPSSFELAKMVSLY